MKYKNWLVAGASGGIGSALVKILLEQHPECHVLATCRNPAQQEQLQALVPGCGGRLRLAALDIENANSLSQLANMVAEFPGELNAVINCSGILHDDLLSPEKSLAQCDEQTMLRVLSVNTVAPLMLLKAVVPAINRSKPAMLATLSAMVGSISDNRLGGWYAYRASKAALNQLLKTLSIELARTHPGATVLALHPGTTDTHLSKPFQSNLSENQLFSPEVTALRLLAVIGAAEPAQTGRFLNWTGAEIPW